MDDLEERLNSHARAFEGLMSLIPAKHYYAQDNSDQWQRKKQTKEEKRKAKRAKLNPENNKSAQDILDENERKRKRVLEGDDYSSDIDAPGKEKPMEGMKKPAKKAKKETVDGQTPVAEKKSKSEENAEADKDKVKNNASKAEKKKEKEQRKKEKLAKQMEKTEAKKAQKAEAAPEEAMDTTEEQEEQAAEQHIGENDIEPLDVSGLVEEDNADYKSSATPSPAPQSPASAASAQQSTSSTSSIVPPATTESSEKPQKINLPKVDQEILKARLQARIDALRAARKADGPDGKPARNRQELLEARRRKQEQRKQHKKELRQLAKSDDQRAAAEAELARLRGSGSPLGTPDIFSPRDEPVNNFSFGRVTFDDGDQMDASLSGFVDTKRKKGPQDPKTALDAAKKKQARLSGLDEAKRADIEEKDLWLNAKKRAHGEKVRDDTSLLKKTLKRKEKQKSKSAKEWDERIAGVQKGKEMKQKKREENLRKRKEEKGGKGGKGGKGKKPAKKLKGRPGFEGSFRSK